MKMFLKVVLILLMMLKVGGCVKNSVDSRVYGDYREEVEEYLKTKYNEDFTVVSARREIRYGQGDIFYALCYNNKYPGVLFNTSYYLDANDVFKKNEIIEILKEAGAHDEANLRTIPEEIEKYFEDKYVDIFYQNKFDEKIQNKKNKDEYFFRTVFEGSYKNKTELIPLDEFIEDQTENLHVYHYVFVNDTGFSKNERYEAARKIAEHIREKAFSKHMISVYFVKGYDVDKIEKLFLDEYEDHHVIFEDSPNTIAKCFFTLEPKGEFISLDEFESRLKLRSDSNHE